MIKFEKDFFNHLNKNFIFEDKPKIAVAVSGGPDSIALVFLLKKWIKNNNGKIIALIVDHKIRDNSLKEAKGVNNYLSRNKIKSFILKVPKKKVFKKKMKEARDNRFSKLISYCKNKHIFHLFVGHHKDDNIETFLLRKIAGSNIEGLNSIKEKTVINGIRILRPLLNFSKKSLISYNKKNNFNYIEDPSNSNLVFTRIFVRNYLSKNKNHSLTVSREFNLVKKNYNDYIKMIFHIFNLVALEIHRKKIIYDLKKFKNLDKEIQTKLIEINYKFLNPQKPFLRYVKITNLLNNLLISNKKNENLGTIKVNLNSISISFLK